LRLHAFDPVLLSPRLGAMLTASVLLLSACSGTYAARAVANETPPTTAGQAESTRATTATYSAPQPTHIPETNSPEPVTQTPTTTPTPPTPASGKVSYPALQSVHMRDANDGWGLSQDGVFYTTDGGQHWKDVTPTNGWLVKSIVKGFFLNATTAWLIQPDRQKFNRGTLFHTKDGGRTWQSSQAPFGPNPMQFLNTNDGWVMADQGAAAGSMAVDIYKTIDGGSSWDKVQSAGPQTQNTPGALPFGGDKSGMAFEDMKKGWIGGSQPVSGHSYLYRTTDGGKTWELQDLSIPAAYSRSSVLDFAPKFFNSKDGILPVNLETQTQNIDFFVTQDGGQTWQSTTVVQGGTAYDIVSFRDIWVWSGKTLRVTHDSGETWSEITPKIVLKGKIQQLDFVDLKTGWAISMDTKENMYLYLTRDGGKTWKQLSK
jgi:photosystem II stability/assembly factor-like uncharacterized protein